MARQLNVSINTPKKPSKLLAVVALVVAFTLPFILVKSFPHKKRNLADSIPLTLPVTESDENSSDIEELEDSFAENQTTDANKHAELPTKSNNSKTSNADINPKTAKPSTPTKAELKIIKTRARDSLASVFARAGLSPQNSHLILNDIKGHKDIIQKLKPNQNLELTINAKTLEKMTLPINAMNSLVITKEGSHYKYKINTQKVTTRNLFLTATIRGSLYNTAKRENIPYTLIKQMTEIFTWDINFARDVKQGDRFTIIYKANYVADKLLNIGNIVAVSYTTQSKALQALLHVNHWGQAEYFTPQGRSLKKSFIRYPLRFSHISSTFSLSRYHPILHYRRAHKGVDLAARIGTPIQATGDGRIIVIGRQNGYGNMIKIKHSKVNSTIYAHMLKFQKGLSKGDFVKRGQIIGFVGQSGLAAGPHCHYEFHVNNQAKNPTTIDLPRGESLSGKDLRKFQAQSQTLLAQLKLFEENHSTKKLG